MATNSKMITTISLTKEQHSFCQRQGNIAAYIRFLIMQDMKNNVPLIKDE